MRVGEMYSLIWENVNMSRKVLTILRSKNGEKRHVALNATALSALAELRKRSDGAGPVVRNLDGEPLAGPRYWFEPALPKAKIRRFSWHCLRHTFASRLVMAGVDLRTVQELMGHKSIEMTCATPILRRSTPWPQLSGSRQPSRRTQLALQLAPAHLSKIKRKRDVSSKLFHGKMLQ
jgi:integrase